MSIQKRNYVPGEFEEVSGIQQGQILVGDWVYFVLDGYFKFELADISISVDDSPLTPGTDYELARDVFYSGLEGNFTGKSIYGMIRYKNSALIGKVPFISGKNFGTMVDNEQMKKYVDDQGLLIEHNQTSGKQGGKENEYFHLNFAQHSSLTTGLFSAGLLSPCACSWDSATGELTVAEVQASLFETPNGVGQPKLFTIPAATFPLVDNSMNFIVVDFNAGSPEYRILQNPSLINETTIIPAETAYRSGPILHPQNWDALGLALSNKIHQSIVKTQRYRREGGLNLSHYGTRNIRITAGDIWVGAVDMNLGLAESTVVEASLIQPDGTRTGVSQFSNFPGLANANRYAVVWVWRGVEDAIHTYLMYSDNDGSGFTLSDAQISQPPVAPLLITSHSVLVGRFIVQTNAASIITQSAWDKAFSSAGVTSHTELSDVVGGTIHLTAEEYSALLSYKGNLEGLTKSGQILVSEELPLGAGFIFSLHDFPTESFWEQDTENTSRIRPIQNKGITSANTPEPFKERALWTVEAAGDTEGNPFFVGFIVDTSANGEYIQAGTRDAGSGYGIFPYYQKDSWYLLRQGWWWLVTTNLGNPEWATSIAYGAGGKSFPDGFYTGYNSEITTPDGSIVCTFGSASTETDSFAAEGSIYSDEIFKSDRGLSVNDGSYYERGRCGKNDNIMVELKEFQGLNCSAVDIKHIEDFRNRNHFSGGTFPTDIVARGNMGAVGIPESMQSIGTAFKLGINTVFWNHRLEVDINGATFELGDEVKSIYNAPIGLAPGAGITLIKGLNNMLFVHTNFYSYGEFDFIGNDVIIFVKKFDANNLTPRTITLSAGVSLYYESKAESIEFGGAGTATQLFWETTPQDSTGGNYSDVKFLTSGDAIGSTDIGKLLIANTTSVTSDFDVTGFSTGDWVDFLVISDNPVNVIILNTVGPAGVSNIGLTGPIRPFDSICRFTYDGVGNRVIRTKKSGVDTSNIIDKAVTNAKLADMAGNTVKVRDSSTTGEPNDMVMTNFSVLAKPSIGGTIQSLDFGENTVLIRSANGGISPMTIQEGKMLARIVGGALGPVDIPSGGGGTLKGTASLSGPLSTSQVGTITVTITGAALGDGVIVNDNSASLSSNIDKWFIYGQRVSATNTVQFRVRGLDYTDVARNFNIVVVK